MEVASPVVALLLSQVGWCGIMVLDAAFQALVIMALSSLAVYAVMLAGWSSNSAYAFVGWLQRGQFHPAQILHPHVNQAERGFYVLFLGFPARRRLPRRIRQPALCAVFHR